MGAFCSIDTSAGCSASGGTYLGDASVCGGGTAGNPTIYQNSPGVAIPDGGGAGNPVTDTITAADSFPIGDVNVDITITCSANVCSYQNVAQGTACDDFLFCTATDECDGNGLCVGSGTSCGVPRFPQCCEGTDECICSTCPCGQ